MSSFASWTVKKRFSIVFGSVAKIEVTDKLTFVPSKESRDRVLRSFAS